MERLEKFRLISSPKRIADSATPAGEKGAGALAPVETPHTDRLARLARQIGEVRAGGRASPRTRRLLQAGPAKMAQKLIEEAAETAIEAIRGERAAVVAESVDLLYNLVVLWGELAISPEEIWAEMDRRDAVLGMSEKLPKAND